MFFSPLHDKGLPKNACGLYLPGGYPELYAAQLAENEPMRRSIKEAVSRGLPTVAECGGFLYLGLVGQMAKNEGVTEQLKSDDWLCWIQKMNSIRSRAEEVVLHGLIYSL